MVLMRKEDNKINSTNNRYLLEMNNICKYFPGVKALEKVSLKVKPGTVHALMGENGAGKSTLMKCLFGIYKKDKGSIILDGKEVEFKNAKDALENGVAMVHQELNQVKQRTVLDNIWLGRYPKNGLFVDEKKMYNDTIVIFDELEITINPNIKVENLSVSEMQMLEIAKAVSYNSKVLVLDEPTSSLTEKEVEHLFKIINKLKKEGCGIIYISHKMEEILKISDEVTIMRDGQWLSTELAKNLTTEKIINQMVGRDLVDRFPKKTNIPKEPLLEVINLTGEVQPTIQDVNFTLRRGEILGIAGLVGSRRTEILESLFGLRKVKSGRIKLNGKEIKNKTPLDAIKNGFALVTEERRVTGIFSVLDVNFNSTISCLKKYLTKIRLLDKHGMHKDTSWVVSSMKVKTPNEREKIGNLSGGNQQKIIIGRGLLTEPDVLMLDEPTRGIDVGAKYEIYQLMNELATKGKGLIIISSEMPELIGTADRILVMSNGKVSGILDGKTAKQEEIMELSAKYL